MFQVRASPAIEKEECFSLLRKAHLQGKQKDEDGVPDAERPNVPYTTTSVTDGTSATVGEDASRHANVEVAEERKRDPVRSQDYGSSVTYI